MPLSAEQAQLFGIFHPFAAGRHMEMSLPNRHFVHYCTAEAAFYIIKSNRMRMRNATVMNDFMEIEYGRRCLITTWNGPAGDRFRRVINGMYPDLLEELMPLVDGWTPHYLRDTYIACMSEHDEAENELGRLSMWRAYGGPSGVAVVLNPTVFLEPNNSLPVTASPVAYLTPEEFAAEFDTVATNILNQQIFLKERGRQLLFNYLFQVFKYSLLCTKHPGFREEREWRIVYSPKQDLTSRVEHSIELIRGVPQNVHSVPFDDHPDEGLIGLELRQLVHRVIVGPTNQPETLREAIISLLNGAGVGDAATRVVCSSIPFRHS